MNGIMQLYEVLKARVSVYQNYSRLSSDKCYEKTKFTHYRKNLYVQSWNFAEATSTCRSNVWSTSA